MDEGVPLPSVSAIILIRLASEFPFVIGADGVIGAKFTDFYCFNCR